MDMKKLSFANLLLGLILGMNFAVMTAEFNEGGGTVVAVFIVFYTLSILLLIGLYLKDLSPR